MSQEHDTSPSAEPMEERITLRMQVHTDAPSHGIILREGPRPTRPRGRVPRIARLLALAHQFQELLDTGVVRTQMELAELTKLTTARITQIMNLLILAPDIQEEILFMPPVTSGDPPVTEKTLRPVLQTLVWSEQRERWAARRSSGGATDRTQT
jgi:hypothetical protein